MRWVQRRSTFALSLEQQGITKVFESGLTRSDLVFVKLIRSSVENGSGKGLHGGCGRTRYQTKTRLQWPPPHTAFQQWLGSVHMAWGLLPLAARDRAQDRCLYYLHFQRKPKCQEVISSLLTQLVNACSSPVWPSLLRLTNWAHQMLGGRLITASKVKFCNSFAIPLSFPNWVEIQEIPLTVLTDELLISNIFGSLKGFSSILGELFLGLLHILPKLLHEFF